MIDKYARQGYYVHSARMPRVAGIGRVFLYAVKAVRGNPAGEVVDVFRTRERAERIRDELNKALYAGEWISVEDELPGESTDVLISRVYQGHRRPFIARLLQSDYPNRWVKHPNVIVLGTVTHWMPLPDPPSTILDYPVKVNENVPDDAIIVTDGKYRVEITNIGKSEEK